MSLRRTGIARKAELRRTPMPRRKREIAAQRVRVKRVRRDTGPTPAQRALVAERAGYCCELCSIRLHDGTGWTTDRSWHHRQPRGMGGSKRTDVNSPTNLLLLCGSGVTGCHGLVESNRAAAYDTGLLVRRGMDPATTPVVLRRTLLVLLTEDGEYQESAA